MTRPYRTPYGVWQPDTDDCPGEMLTCICCDCGVEVSADDTYDWTEIWHSGAMRCPECSPDADWHRLIGILPVDDVRAFVRRIATMAPTALVRAETETWA